MAIAITIIGGAVDLIFLLDSILFAHFVFDAEDVHRLGALEQNGVDRPL